MVCDNLNSFCLDENMISESKDDATEKWRILIVDDMQMHLETAKLYLEKEGNKVFLASDANSAWALLEKEAPDLILLDVVLPGENGLELLTKIKTYHPGIGVIIMTSYSSEEVATAALKLGATDYIKKPLKYSSLNLVVEKALAKLKKVKDHQTEVESLKNAFEELQVSAESILHCMSAGVVAVDINLKIKIINQRAEILLGVRKDDVIEKYYYDAFPFFVNTSLLKNTLENEKNIRMYEVEIAGRGGVRTLNINTDIIYNLLGKKIGAVAVFDDVTELKNKEQLLKERERLAIIGQMAAGMAHELKNPLTSIKGFAQLLLNRSNAAAIPDDFLQVMINETNRMNQVIQDFLQLARPKPPEYKMVNINDILMEIAPIIEPQAFLKNISLNINTSDGMPRGMMDPNQIKQVILNILQNAMEAMENRGNIVVETRFVEENNEIRMDIRDTGPGIPPDKINKIGVPFYSSKPNGTGLGLSISFSLVEQHRGRIEIQSREGRGTTFSVFLPVN
ncbi:sensor histidine kinase [Desulfocucumis palustris]|uniref:Stage 0 sporulation protein A homolog n=1 Tax=Desulfocucumis palustris TaxID=1898651 RepID=A0A2L2XGZ2_9FIRM|nr:hybrid sensor histidine kinase/response regulator [Desulfocucumis palustris]GBF34983.1 sensor histidine kinase [Desulfocucumis palustris]